MIVSLPWRVVVGILHGARVKRRIGERILVRMVSSVRRLVHCGLRVRRCRPAVRRARPVHFAVVIRVVNGPVLANVGRVRLDHLGGQRGRDGRERRGGHNWRNGSN